MKARAVSSSAIRVIAIAAGVLAFAPMAAHASTTTVSFDDAGLAAGQRVTTQFAVMGVTLGGATAVGFPLDESAIDCGEGPTVIADDPDNDQFSASAPNAAELEQCHPNDGHAVSSVFGSFGSTAQNAVSVKLRLTSGEEGTDSIDLNAYDAAGTVISTVTHSVNDQGWTTFTFTQPGTAAAAIRFFSVVRNQNDTIAIDDLSFTHPDALPALTIMPASLDTLVGDPVGPDLGTLTDPATSATAAKYQLTVDWGDGTTSTSSSASPVTVSGASSPFSLTGTHTYSTAGSHPVALHVVADDGRTADATTTATITARPLPPPPGVGNQGAHDCHTTDECPPAPSTPPCGGDCAHPQRQDSPCKADPRPPGGQLRNWTYEPAEFGGDRLRFRTESGHIVTVLTNGCFSGVQLEPRKALDAALYNVGGLARAAATVTGGLPSENQIAANAARFRGAEFEVVDPYRGQLGQPTTVSVDGVVLEGNTNFTHIFVNTWTGELTSTDTSDRVEIESPVPSCQNSFYLPVGATIGTTNLKSHPWELGAADGQTIGYYDATTLGGINADGQGTVSWAGSQIELHHRYLMPPEINGSNGTGRVNKDFFAHTHEQEGVLQEDDYCQRQPTGGRRSVRAVGAHSSGFTNPCPANASPTTPIALQPNGGFTLCFPNLYLGAMDFTHAFLSYSPSNDEWDGGGDFNLVGVVKIQATPTDARPFGGFHFTSAGKFLGAGAAIDFGGGGLDIVPPFVQLTHIDFQIGTHPTVIDGGIGVGVIHILDVQGNFLGIFASPDGPFSLAHPIEGFPQFRFRGPFTTNAFAVSAQLSLLDGDLPLGGGYVLFVNSKPVYIEFGANVTLGDPDIIGAQGHVIGQIGENADRRGHLAFDVEGGGEADVLGFKVAGGNIVISSRALAACAYTFLTGSFGFGFTYPNQLPSTPGEFFHDILHDTDIYPPFIGESCDGHIGEYRAHFVNARVAGAAAAVAPTVNVPAGLLGEAIEVKGQDGVPAVVVTDPSGHAVTIPTTGKPLGRVGNDVGYLRFAPRNTAYIGLSHPKPGTWTVTPQPGSPAIAGITTADRTAPSSVTTRVTGHGTRRVLHYRAHLQPGDSIALFERVVGGLRGLAKVHGSAGSASFVPASGPGGIRKIVAQITGPTGVPESSKPKVVGHYAAPQPPTPGKPGHLRVTRRGGDLVVKWTGGTDTARFSVALTRGSGRPDLVDTAGKTTSLTFPDTGPGPVRVSVRGIDAAQRRGPSAHASLGAMHAPGKVSLHAAKTSSNTVLTWKDVRSAVSYRIRIALKGSPALTQTTTRHSVTIHPAKGASVKVSVRGVDALGRVGPSTTRTVKGR